MPKTVQEELHMKFDILKTIASDGVTARLGRLALPRREAIDTPNFFAVTSRGVLPHVTPDNLARYAKFPGVYMAMEDCEFSNTTTLLLLLRLRAIYHTTLMRRTK